MSRRAGMTLLLMVLGLLTACGSGSDTTAPSRPDTEGLSEVVGPFPVPTDDVVLTIVGGDRPNVGDRVEADLVGIESLGTTTVTIFEPHIEADVEITGVPIERVLAAAGVDDAADLRWTALDDYQVGYSGAAAAADGGILATRMDGEPIDIVDGGPIRMFFADGEGTIGRDATLWIWSLYLIEVG